MEIEYEVKNGNEETIQGDEEKNQRMRGRKKKQKQRWEETIEVFLPMNIKETDNKQNGKEQKEKYKKNQSGEMEVEEQNSSQCDYKDSVKQMQQKQGHYKTIFELNEYYQAIIENEKFNIQRDNFENLIRNVFDIIQNKMVETPNFLNYIQLLVEKSHLDMLKEFNKQLNFDVKMKYENKIHLISYEGNNQLYKILTHFKNGIDSIIEQIEKEDQKQKNNKRKKDELETQEENKNQKVKEEKDDLKFIQGKNKKIEKKTILCLFDGAYNISKQDMIDIGKFLSEDYETYSEMFQIIIVIPINFQSPIADIQIYTVEFCKSKDLFVKLLLFLLKSEQFPPLPLELLKNMLLEFDFYQITYNEQVRRIQLAIASFLYTHQNQSDLIEMLLQMKQNAQTLLHGQMFEEEEQKEEQNENKSEKRKRSRTNQKLDLSIKKQDLSVKKKQDLCMKKKEIKAIMLFLERLYSYNFITLEENDQNSFSQSVIYQNHRILELVLSKDKRYVMPKNQQQGFIKNSENVCSFIYDILKYEQESAGQYCNFFNTYINNFEYLDKAVEQEQEKLKNMMHSQRSQDRFQKAQQMSKIQQSSTTMTKEQKAIIKKDKVEDIVRQILVQLHQNFIEIQTPQLQINLNSLHSQFRPDLLGSIFSQIQKEKPTLTKDITSNKQEAADIIHKNTDGMNLMYLIQDSGRDINIQEQFNEYKALLLENNIKSDKDMIQASFYNAICELRFYGLLGEKNKLKHTLIKHFFAKTSYFPLSRDTKY